MFMVVSVWAGHCLVPSLSKLSAAAHPGTQKAIHSEIGNPPVKRKYKRTTLRNAVGKHTRFLQHNELVSLFGLLQYLFWQQGGCINKLDVWRATSYMHTLIICLACELWICIYLNSAKYRVTQVKRDMLANEIKFNVLKLLITRSKVTYLLGTK